MIKYRYVFNNIEIEILKKKTTESDEFVVAKFLLVLELGLSKIYYCAGKK